MGKPNHNYTMASHATKNDVPEETESKNGAEPKGAERREYKRYELNVDVNFESASNFFTGLTQDISRGGLFVATYDLRAVGEQVAVKFQLPDEPQPIELTAVVKWVRENTSLHRSETYGIGLQFVDLPAETAAIIDRFMTKRDSIFYDVD
jgi:uncharacterized protein (TIGR02266 family)